MWDKWLNENMAVLLSWPDYELSIIDTCGIVSFQLIIVWASPFNTWNSFSVSFASEHIS